jgi:histidyl-tRNA synthetase
MLAADTLEVLGLKGKHVVKVNNRKVLDGLMENEGVTESQHLATMRAIDKLDRLGEEGVAALLGKGRKDESGDVTKGANLPPKTVNAILNFTGARDSGLSGAQGVTNAVTIANMELYVGSSAIGIEGRDELLQLAALIESAGYADRIRIDPSVVRGLEYYTGPVFEAELTSPIKDERGQPIRLGSVVSGGRYDGLVERFTGEKVPATGISIGVSRLLFGLKTLGKIGAEATQGPVVILVLDKDRMADYQRMAQTLRAAGIRAEIYLGEAGMKAQMKYADKRNSPCAVIQGGDEKAKGEVTIKDLILGANLTAIKDRDEYLKKQAEAQFAVKESELVEAVKRVLARHKS